MEKRKKVSFHDDEDEPGDDQPLVVINDANGEKAAKRQRKKPLVPSKVTMESPISEAEAEANADIDTEAYVSV